MPLYDYACPNCGEFEDFGSCKKWFVRCPRCGRVSKRLITIGRINLANDDAPHVRESANALIDKETARFSDKEHVRNLALRPTRANLNAYMKAEKIRYAENEGGAPPRYRPPEPTDKKKLTEELYTKHRKRRALEVHTR